MCDLQLLPCQEEPAPMPCCGQDATPLPRRAAERLLAAMRRTEKSAEAALAETADDTGRRLALLEISVALGPLQRARSDAAMRLLVLAHAGRARRAYARAYGGKR
ncbi:MAG TPA: hypothetical protein VFE34_01860 [Dongiaceae bacterium]|nr:hypothetical protein [Dongiaceae bacterium]